jgi:hypothetical protein
MADSSDTAHSRPMQDWITLTFSHITNLSHARIMDASTAMALLPRDDNDDDNNNDDDANDNDDDGNGDSNSNSNSNCNDTMTTMRVWRLPGLSSSAGA